NGSLEFFATLTDTQVLEVFDGVPQFKIEKSDLGYGIDLATLLAEKTSIFPSKGEVKKTVQGGGLSINKQTPADAAVQYTVENLLNGRYIIVQKGKKNYFLIVAE